MKLCIAVWLLAVVGPNLTLAFYDYQFLNGSNVTGSYNEPATEPNKVRNLFDLNQHEYDDIVSKAPYDGIHKGPRYVFNEAIIEMVKENVIPELCYLTSDNITIYNSFLLDRTCLKLLEQVSPECRGFKCQLAHYFLEHGPRVFVQLFQTDTLGEAAMVMDIEIEGAFRRLNMCTCGREFFKAAFKCAPYYYANALFALVDNRADDLCAYSKFARRIDLKSASKVFDRLMEGFCEETESGICLKNILYGFHRFAEMLETTIDGYDSYDAGTRKFRKNQDMRCNNLFRPFKTWENDERRLPESGIEVEKEYIEILFSKTAAVADSFFCYKHCKRPRHEIFYPCCLKKIVEDQKMWDNVEMLVESVFRAVPSLNFYFQFKNYGKFWDWQLRKSFWREFSEEEFESYKTFTLPKVVRENFMRTVNAPKYCQGKAIKCWK